jgi:short-subunit dehydrogenase
MARQLAERGYGLVLVARSEAKLREAAQALSREHAVRADVCPVDLSQPGSAQRLFDFVRERVGDVDVLINNAGVGLYGEHSQLSLAEMTSMLQLNVASLAELCLLFGKEMKRRGSGRILNIASTAAYQPTPYFAAYGASKAFVLNFSEALAKELEGFGVSVTCLSPGPTDTGFFNGVDRAGGATSHFDKGSRDSVATVAKLGLDAMLAGNLSRIVGVGNALRAFSLRFASRNMVANVSKNMMAPKAASH